MKTLIVLLFIAAVILFIGSQIKDEL